jgi:hypothetical protein
VPPRWLVALALLGSASAGAQTFLPKYSVFGQVGAARIYDDEGSIGTGFYGGGGMGFRFHRRLGAEFELFRFKHERSVAGGLLRFAGTGNFYMGNALLYFSDRRVQPYVVGGIGALDYINRSNLASTPETRSTRLAGNAGFGIQGFLSRRASLRPEVRLTWGGTRRAAGIEPPISALRFSIGLGYHW